MINVLAEIGLTFTKFKVIEFDEESSNIITEINAPISPIHSFAITENYIIVVSIILNCFIINIYIILIENK